MIAAASSRDEVKERLLRTAAEVWGMPGIRSGQVDPLVGLLFGAMALEIERIGHAIHDSDARVFERIARYLLPEVLALTEPAHAIVKLSPERRVTATRYEEMSFEQTVRRKENMNRPETKEYFFSAAGDVPLSGSRIVCRIVADEVSRVDGLRWSNCCTLPNSIGSQAMYLGFHGELEENEVIRLYFDWPGHAARERCILALSRITAHSVNGDPLFVGIGLAPEASEAYKGDTNDISDLLEQRVRAFYHERFLRVRVGDLPGGAPSDITPLLEQAGLSDAGTLRWLRLDFPSEMGHDLLKDAQILDNCAPVINRRLEKAIYRLQHELNIKRLDAHGAFLGMEKAESNKGQVYAKVPSAEQVDSTPGTFTIRYGATARFDERDGGQLIQHAIDQIREESRAFASMDLASTVSDLRSVAQSLSRIERRLQETSVGTAQTYAALRPFDETETAHLHYWTTDGEAANGIPAGTVLRSSQQVLSPRSGIRLVTTTVGAREKRSQKELVQQYRAVVLARGRIVTRRDIMEHCRVAFGSRLKEVSVEDGIMLSPDQQKGLVRCLEVVLTVDNKAFASGELSYLRERLLSELNTASALSLPIRLR